MRKLINDKKYLTLILIGLLTLVIGTSLSFIMFDLSGSDNSIQTGQISMTYVEPSNEVVLKDQLPITDEVGMNQDKYFEFSVISNATTNEKDDNGIEIPYEISLTPTKISSEFNELENNQIKIYLTKVVGEEEQVVLAPTLISDLKQSKYRDSVKIYDTSNTHSNNSDTITTKYRIRFWIDNNVNATNWYKENKYEYRFVVNINAEANKNTSKMLAQTIRSLYTIENKTAKEENGYYYLTGIEELDDLTTEQNLLYMFGSLANVYYYRRADGTYDMKQYNDDYYNFLVNIEQEYTKEEYQEEVGPFGSASNLVLGLASGVIVEEFDPYVLKYADGKTIDDIPTIEEVLADPTMKEIALEYFGYTIDAQAAYIPSTFQKIYSNGASINEELLNENLELGGIAAGASDMIATINAKFGNISNYAIAQAYEMIDYDTIDFIEGKTVDDLPTLDELFLNYTGPTLITNNYVRLNNLLYEVIGINSDNTVKLLLVDSIRSITKNFSGYLGIGLKNESSSAYLSLMKDTTLSGIIQKKDYKYFIDNEAKYINSYVSLLTKEDIEKSNLEYRYSFLIDQLKDRYAPVAHKENEKQIYYDYSSFGTYGYEPYAIVPTITIEDIKVEGEGTRSNPYYIKDEKIVSDLNVAYAINNALKYNYSDSYSLTWNFASDSPYYLKNTVEHFKKYNLDLANSNMNYTNNGNIFLGLNINGVCYYSDSYGKIYKSEDTGNCVAPEESATFVQKINGEEKTTYTTYLNYEEVTLSLEGVEEGVTYQWQYSDSSSSYATWHDLKDGKNVFEEENKMTVSGANTKELKILPIASDNSSMYFRCVINNVYTDKMAISFNDEEILNVTWTPAKNNSGYSYVYYGDTVTFEADVLGASDYWIEKYTDNGSVKYGHTKLTQMGQQHIKLEVKIDESFIDGNLKICFKGPDDSYDACFRDPVTILNISGPEIITQPKSIEVGTGYTGTLKVNARGALYYQWQQKIGEEWVNLEDIENKISGTTTDKLKITTTSEMEIVTSYRCLLKTKEELYTNEVTITLIEADEDWQYEKITDADGIPTGELNVVKYIGSYEESNSVKVVENYFNMAKAAEKGYDITDNWVHEVFFGEGLISPAAYYRVAREEYGIAKEDIDTKLIRDLIKDDMRYYGSTKKNKDIDWDKYYAGYNNAYEITLPRSYKGQAVIGATKMLFNHEIINKYDQDVDYGYNDMIEEYLTTGTTTEIEGSHVINITIPEGYKYIGNDIPMEEFAEKHTDLDYDRIDYNVIRSNSVISMLSNLENIDFASTIELIGTGAVFRCNNTGLTEVLLPKNLKKLNAYFHFGLSNLKFQEGATIKEITKDNFVIEYSIRSFEVPASVEKIGPGLIHYYVNSEDREISQFQEITFEDTAERPSQLNIIEDGADLCKYCQALKLPSNLKTIGIGAFFNNSYLTELEIPASVEEIRAGAFYKAPLTKLTLHEGLKEIKSSYEQDGETGEIAAFGSSVLKELSVPSSVTKVESKAFTNAQFENLKIYGKTTLADFTDYVDGTFTMAEGYTPQFVQGTLE